MKIQIDLIPENQRTNSRDIFQAVFDLGKTKHTIHGVTLEDILYNVEGYLKDIKDGV